MDDSVNNLVESYLQPNGLRPNFIVIGTAIVSKINFKNIFFYVKL
jgi:hypothetical protein